MLMRKSAEHVCVHVAVKFDKDTYIVKRNGTVCKSCNRRLLWYSWNKTAGNCFAATLVVVFWVGGHYTQYPSLQGYAW